MSNVYAPAVYKTRNGTSYLKEPGVALIAKPSFEPQAIEQFIDGFGDEFNSDDYVNDFIEYEGDMDSPRSLKLDDGASLVKFAGQLCYLSMGMHRTRNSEAEKYLTHIKESGHGSVLEHANYSFLFWGIDRAVTHELVRHRAGMAYSQVSQRYVSGKTLRFVERPEYQADAVLHSIFEERIDHARHNYDAVAKLLMDQQKAGQDAALSKTEARKAVNQAARSGLPNETEAPIVVTGNVRAWRNVIEQRASKWADKTIQKLASITCAMLKDVSPLLFGDYEPDGEIAVKTRFRKV